MKPLWLERHPTRAKNLSPDLARPWRSTPTSRAFSHEPTCSSTVLRQDSSRRSGGARTVRVLRVSLFSQARQSVNCTTPLSECQFLQNSLYLSKHIFAVLLDKKQFASKGHACYCGRSRSLKREYTRPVVFTGAVCFCRGDQSVKGRCTKSVRHHPHLRRALSPSCLHALFPGGLEFSSRCEGVLCVLAVFSIQRVLASLSSCGTHRSRAVWSGWAEFHR